MASYGTTLVRVGWGRAALSLLPGRRGFSSSPLHFHCPLRVCSLLLHGHGSLWSSLGFHLYHKLPTIVPESCLLIMVGLLLGGIIFGVDEKSPPAMKTDVFFLYLLPPIVLDAGYFMPTRPFFENIGTIFWYAVVGTLWNSIGIGVSLFGICQIEAFGLSDITLLQNLLFGSLISAVDPVAVLAVFENIHVNEQLYILVFGESLLNDAVTVVLYNLFKSFCQMKTIETVDVFAGIANFFVVGIGGVLIGIFLGFIAAFTTRFTHNIRVIEPLFVFLYSYLSYITAEMFHLSGIMVINWFRTIPLTFKDQFIIAYGGLRGAICFALVFLLPSSVFPRKKLFITAAIVVIFFTVFILGITIRPLVEFLDVKRSNKKQQAVSEEIHCRFFDHVKTGIEDVCGHWGHNFWRDKFKKFDDKYLRKLLIRENQPKSSIVSLYKKLEIKHAIEMAETGMISTVPSFASLNDCREEKVRKLTPGEMDEIREILSRNLYQIRQRTLSYNRHNLTADTSERQAKEILIRRRHSLRESVRKDSSLNREHRASTSTSRYLSLPKNTKLPEKLQKKKNVSNAGGNSSDSDLEAGTTVLNLQPRARRFLPEQFSKKAPQAYKMEWKNEVDVDSRQDQPHSSPAAHSKEGCPQTPGVLCQPLLSKGHFGSVRGDRVHEGIRPQPPPRLVRRASEPGNRKGRFGSEKP
ncbi:hypothetical protein FD755_008724 [Muntiacus reevesi]|uniref:Sodium/hydrogen exchanger n=1 Tax=Muntiacus reevesi TaxID=9886 RepID=A0A5J5MLB6_MUNRE|nr:hypothetical protein FD755_008724 [Muntiacus reevesi]